MDGDVLDLRAAIRVSALPTDSQRSRPPETTFTFINAMLAV